MPRPTSFRLPEELLDRLDSESRAGHTSVTALVASLLDEGLKIRRFPGIVYRDGPTGRRAALLEGPDVWEVVRDLTRTHGHGMDRVENLAAEVGLSEYEIRLVADFYATFPTEIDALIEADELAAEQVRKLVAERERLLSL